MTKQEEFDKACLDGDLETVKRLLNDPEIYPAAGGNQAICWAAENGHVDAAKILLADDRVDPTTIISNLIDCGSLEKKAEIVDLLVNAIKERNSGEKSYFNSEACEEYKLHTDPDEVVEEVIQDMGQYDYEDIHGVIVDVGVYQRLKDVYAVIYMSGATDDYQYEIFTSREEAETFSKKVKVDMQVNKPQTENYND